MTTEELKAFYEANPENWIVVDRLNLANNSGINDIWLVKLQPRWLSEWDYKLINIKHKQVLEAYLADNSVWIQHNNAYIVNDFIENYNPDLEYKLKESNMLRCPKCGSATNSRERSPNGSTTCLDCKFYTSNSNWDELLREKEDDSRPTINDSSYSNSDNRNENMVDTQLNNFQDFGFTADFEGEILKEVDGRYIGWSKRVSDIAEANAWRLDGSCCYSVAENLTPIKKDWYEQRPLKFPFAVSDTFGIRLVHGYDDLALAIDSGYDKATKEEVMSLYSQSKE